MKTISVANVQGRTNLLNNLSRSDTLWHLNRPLELPLYLKKDDSLSHISRLGFLEHLRKSDLLLHLRHGEYKPTRRVNLIGRLRQWERDYKLFGIDLNQRKPSGQLALDFTHKLLTYANDAYMWDHPFKFTPVKKLPFGKPPVEVLADQISKKLLGISNSDLEFVFSFPYVQNEIYNLIISLNNNDPSFSQTLVDLNQNIDKALMAKVTGLYIPGTDIFVFKESFREVSDSEFKELDLACKRLDDIGEILQETFFIELCSIEDAFAIAWKPYGCTFLDWPLGGQMSEYAIPSGAQFLRHEDQHHTIRAMHKYGLMDDPNLEINAKSSLLLDCADVDEWIEEAVAHSTDIETILKIQPKDLDWDLIIETCLSVQAVIDALRSPKIIGGISKEGLHKLALAEDRNRKILLSIPSYACSL
jgi:hypothetical protein